MKLVAALVVVCVSRIASASELTLDRTCVEIDATTDALAEPDRARAIERLQRVLERENLFVVTSDCTETYTLSHERDGQAYVIRLRSSAGKRRMTGAALDDISPKYRKLVRSLIDAKVTAVEPQPQPAVATLSEPTEPLPTVSEASEPAQPERRYEENVFYAAFGPQLTGGGGFTLGFRHALTSTVIDIGANFRSSSTETRATTFSAKLLLLRAYTTSIQGYVGGGLSAGKIEHGMSYGTSHYWGAGVHGELTAGLQIGKVRTLQLFTELDLTLPFYEVGNDDGAKKYTPLAMLAFGAGF